MSCANGFHNTDVDDNFEEIRIEVPWGHIAGKWWGPRHIQPILAIHGWQDNAGSFDTLVPLIRDDETSILCIDLPGHGFSSHQPKGHFYFVFWDGVLVVRRIIKHFNWEKITILGHSLGGAIAFLYASIYPNDIKCYIALDVASPTPREPSTMVPIFGAQIDRFLSFDSGTTQNYSFQDLIDHTLTGYQDSLTKESVKLLLKRGAQKSMQNQDFYSYTRDNRLKVISLGAFTLEQILVFADRIRCNVLNIKSSVGTNLQNFEIYNVITNRIAQATKKCENYVVEGTHHVHLNNPERVSEMIVNFLNVNRLK